ncbi:MAG: HAMP domain-containing sensor histidine kinase [Gemmatimonadota bacterium]
MTAADPPGGIRAAIAALDQQAEHVASQWVDLLLKKPGVHPRSALPTDALRGGGPALVRRIAEHLDHNECEQTADWIETLRSIATGWRAGGYAVQEVLAAIDVLGDAVFDNVYRALDAADSNPAEERVISRGLYHGLSELGTSIAGLLEELAADEARQRIEDFEDFASALSHELKNPLGAARGAADLLIDDDSGRIEEVIPHLSAIVRRNIDRALTLLDDLRTFTRVGGPGSGAADRKLLRGLIRAAFEEVEQRAHEAGADLRIKEPIPTVHVDAPRVQLALMNLVWNAVKYSDPGKAERFVDVRAEFGQSGSLRIEVADNGIGIPPAVQHRVFKRFFRAAPDRSEGTGLGLAITREAIQQLGGDVAFVSEPDQGTTFIILLPPTATGIDPEAPKHITV